MKTITTEQHLAANTRIFENLGDAVIQTGRSHYAQVLRDLKEAIQIVEQMVDVEIEN